MAVLSPRPLARTRDSYLHLAQAAPAAAPAAVTRPARALVFVSHEFHETAIGTKTRPGYSAHYTNPEIVPIPLNSAKPLQLILDHIRTRIRNGQPIDDIILDGHGGAVTRNQQTSGTVYLSGQNSQHSVNIEDLLKGLRTIKERPIAARIILSACDTLSNASDADLTRLVKASQELGISIIGSASESNGMTEADKPIANGNFFIIQNGAILPFEEFRHDQRSLGLLLNSSAHDITLPIVITARSAADAACTQGSATCDGLKDQYERVKEFWKARTELRNNPPPDPKSAQTQRNLEIVRDMIPHLGEIYRPELYNLIANRALPGSPIQRQAVSDALDLYTSGFKRDTIDPETNKIVHFNPAGSAGALYVFSGSQPFVTEMIAQRMGSPDTPPTETQAIMWASLLYIQSHNPSAVQPHLAALDAATTQIRNFLANPDINTNTRQNIFNIISQGLPPESLNNILLETVIRTGGAVGSPDAVKAALERQILAGMKGDNPKVPPAELAKKLVHFVDTAGIKDPAYNAQLLSEIIKTVPKDNKLSAVAASRIGDILTNDKLSIETRQEIFDKILTHPGPQLDKTLLDVIARTGLNVGSVYNIRSIIEKQIVAQMRGPNPKASPQDVVSGMLHFYDQIDSSKGLNVARASDLLGNIMRMSESNPQLAEAASMRLKQLLSDPKLDLAQRQRAYEQLWMNGTQSGSIERTLLGITAQTGGLVRMYHSDDAVLSASNLTSMIGRSLMQGKEWPSKETHAIGVLDYVSRLSQVPDSMTSLQMRAELLIQAMKLGSANPDIAGKASDQLSALISDRSIPFDNRMALSASIREGHKQELPVLEALLKGIKAPASDQDVKKPVPAAAPAPPP